MSIDIVLAGYRVASRAARPDWQEERLPAGDLVSMSDCVVDVVTGDPEGWDGWFDDAGSAEQARVAAGRANLGVLGVGIAAADVAALLADIVNGGESATADTVPDRLAGQVPVAIGTVLGFELMGYDCGWGTWHTWACLGGLVREVWDATGVAAGRFGLIQDEGDARRAAGWLTASGLGDPKVFLWVAAQLVAVPG